MHLGKSLIGQKVGNIIKVGLTFAPWVTFSLSKECIYFSFSSLRNFSRLIPASLSIALVNPV